MSTITYRVRQGFSYVVNEGLALVLKIEGEFIDLPVAVGDGVHQLERADQADAAAEEDAAAKAEADAAAKATKGGDDGNK